VGLTNDAKEAIAERLTIYIVPSMEVIIRPYEPRDGNALADVMFRSVRQGALRDYAAVQVEAWLPAPPEAAWFDARARDGRIVLVAVTVDDTVVAFADLEDDGHIDLLYCAPEAIGHGVASRLYDELETLARRHDIAHLYVEASEAARRVLERKGFIVRERRDLERNGVALHNYAMTKELAR
jgi:putative acetyltransferase